MTIRKAIIFLLLPILWFAPTSQAKISIDAQGRTVIPLSDLIQSEGDLILRGLSGSANITLPVSNRIKIKDAVLELVYINSIALKKGRSQLEVSLNNTIIAQIALNASQAQGTVRIKIPLEYLNNGYNQISLTANQHVVETCGNEDSPERWTRINTEKSKFIIKASYKTLKPTLSEIDRIIDRKLWDEYQLTVLNIEPGVSEELLKWGSSISQGAAMQLDYKHLKMRLSPAFQYTPPKNNDSDKHRLRLEQWNFPGLDQRKLPNNDVVLVGTKEQLIPFLSSQIINNINGSFLGIYPQDENAKRFIIVISGQSIDEVTQAAQAFSYGYTGLPNRSSTIIDGLQTHGLQYNSKIKRIQPQNSYSFEQLNFSTSEMSSTSGGKKIKIWAPADIFSPEDKDIKLHLHLTYGAGFGEMSVLNIMLNGVFQGDVDLSNPNGGTFHNYQFHIPVSSLSPGLNTIEFIPTLVPLKRAVYCETDYIKNLRLTLFDDSSLEIPQALRMAALPSLKIFKDTGYPYFKENQSKDTYVELTNTEPDSVSSAWTMIAKLTQLAKTPLHGLQISSTPSMTPKHVLLFTTEDELRQRYQNNSPRVIQKLLHAPNNPSSQPSTEIDGGGFISTLFDDLFGSEMPLIKTSELKSPLNEMLIFSQSQQGKSTLSQHESQQHAGHLVTIISAENSRSLREWTEYLTDDTIWSSINGDLVEWNDGMGTPTSFRISPQFQIGDEGFRSRIGHYFSLFPFQLSAIIILLLIITGWLTHRILIRNQSH